LRQVIEETSSICSGLGIDLTKIQTAYGFERVRLIDDAVDAILVNDESKRKYMSLAGSIVMIFRSILPDPKAGEFYPKQALFAILAEKIRSMVKEADISGVMKAVDELLVDLSRIDFEALKARFEKGRKHIETEKLRSEINLKLVQIVRLNKSRTNYLDKFQKMIDEYNSSSYNIETFFAKLVKFAQELNAEEKRGIAEKLTEEELAIFDLLTKPEMTLKNEKLVLDWRKRQQSRAAVRESIEVLLDIGLPLNSYTKELFQIKCDVVYQHIYDSYFGQGLSIYANAI